MADELEQGGKDRGAGPAGGSFRLVRQTVLHKVRSAIASGELKPGSRLTERELCETYGISRTAAREVIRQLDAEKLGEVVPHQGLRIVRLTEKIVREIFEIRAELEVLIIRAFIANATDAQIAHLAEIIRRVHDATEAQDAARIVEHSTRFVSYMNETADKRIAGEILAQLNARIMMVRALAISRPGQTLAGLRQMDRIRERAAARDVDGAEVAVRRYIQLALDSALHQLQEAVD